MSFTPSLCVKSLPSSDGVRRQGHQRGIRSEVFMNEISDLTGVDDNVQNLLLFLLSGMGRMH